MAHHRPLTQVVCKTWWGRHIDSMRDRAWQMHQGITSVKFSSVGRQCVEIPSGEFVPGALWLLPDTGEQGRHDSLHENTGR